MKSEKASGVWRRDGKDAEVPGAKCEAACEGLDVCSYDGAAYVRAVSFGAWRVAFLNHDDAFAAPTYLERHFETDESFVLLAGEAMLIVGLERKKVPLAPFKIYNVRKGVWHQIVTAPGTRCLVVENENTSLENSERKPL